MYSGFHLSSMGLLTDLYQLTMAYGYFKAGKAEEEAVFNLYFRKNPFKGGYVITAGLENVIEYINDFQYSDNDISYLRALTGNDGKALFGEDFLEYLRNLKFTCSIEAIPEGTVVFPNEPLLRVTGPILQCQLLETPLLTIINFQSLIATKAARIRHIAPQDTLMEFGLRRAQGPDGGISASRAAYIGGFDGTSNVLAGKLFNIPVKGTHAHSWVMAFDTESESFDVYADVLPNNVTLLVDTYDTLEGVKKAIRTGLKLKERGYQLAAIRLDSGDLAYLSIEARKLLDQAGFQETGIVASNDLDEYLIASLKNQGAPINIWGVGTNLVTASDNPALGGVYKLAAMKNKSGNWDYKIKLSEQTIKINTPGIQQVRRFKNKDGFVGDMIFNIETPPKDNPVIIDPLDFTKKRTFGANDTFEDLLITIYTNGKLNYTLPTIEKIKERVAKQMASLHQGIKRFANPHVYPVGLEEQLFDLKTDLILNLRENKQDN